MVLERRNIMNPPVSSLAHRRNVSGTNQEEEGLFLFLLFSFPLTNADDAYSQWRRRVHVHEKGIRQRLFLKPKTRQLRLLFFPCFSAKKTLSLWEIVEFHTRRGGQLNFLLSYSTTLDPRPTTYATDVFPVFSFPPSFFPAISPLCSVFFRFRVFKGESKCRNKNLLFLLCAVVKGD